MKTIECKGIKKFYGQGDNITQALKGIDLDINDGKLTLLVGPSGSGKTTLLSIMHTILTPDAGDLFILGQDIQKMNNKEKAQFRSENIGMIFQALFLIPTLTVLENTILPMTIQGKDEDEAKTKAITLLKQLGIGHKCDFPPTHLSRGQQQRVAIARALINDPKIIMCDEPTSALDHHSGSEFMELLREHLLHDHSTVFVVTHDQRIFTYADRIIRIDDGIIEEDKHA